MIKVFFPLLFLTSSLLAQPLLADTCALSGSTEIHPQFRPDSLLAHALQYIGRPYKARGKTPATGFDCSGFVCYNFKKFNISLPHSSSAQIRLGRPVKPEDAQAGDLIFFTGSNAKSGKAGHVGIVVAANGNNIKFIHSAIKGGVRLDSTTSSYYQKRYIGIKRIVTARSTL